MKQAFIDIRHHGSPQFRQHTLALALVALTMTGAAQAGEIFTQPDTAFKGRVSVMEATHPGSTVTLRGRGFKPGQQVRLLSNGQPITAEQVIKVDEQGGFKTRVSVPASAVVGRHPVVVQVSHPAAASIYEFKVSSKLPLSGTDRYRIDTQPLKPGLYESAYSAASKALFVTATSGRPPAAISSTLMKVDPDTLKATISLNPATGADGTARTVYGVAVDDAQGTVWISDTRNDTVAVYRQKDLSLIKQFPSGIVNHSRAIAVDSRNGRAYVTSTRGGEIVVFDTRKLDKIGSIYLKSALNQAQIPVTRPMALALDADKGKLYTVSATTNEVFVIDLGQQAVEKVIPLPGALNASGIALAPAAGILFIASQDSDNVLLLDLKEGRVKHELTVGAGALNVVWEPVKQRAYVASRASGTVAVIDTAGKLLANLPAGPLANQLSTDGQGNVFAVNKSRGPDDSQGDHITRFTAR